MNRDNFLFAIIGLLLGFIFGFMLHGVMSQRDAIRPVGTQAQSLPPNHPAVGNDQGGDPQQVFQQVVLVPWPHAGMWRIGFITGRASRELQASFPSEVEVVYVPHSPNPASGFVHYVPKADAFFRALC